VDVAVKEVGVWRNSHARAISFVRVTLLLLGILLVPLTVGAWVIDRQATSRADAKLDRALAHTASEEAITLQNYFDRARSVILISAHNPAFRTFYELPGSRLTNVRARGEVLVEAENALAYLETLYPGSIGEACFIDAHGAENARVVHGHRAPFHHLAHDESKNPFFAPTFALRPGQVHQARPYVSPDTRAWVMSNSTPVATRDGVKRAMVHFEVTIESFRRRLSAASTDTAVVDAKTGMVVVDSRVRQRVGAALGTKDRRFLALADTERAQGVMDLAGEHAAYRRLERTPGNANDWYVVAYSNTSGSLLGDYILILAALAALLLLISLIMGHRWARMNRELVTERLHLAVERQVSEERYRALFEEAEAARSALAGRNERLLELDKLKDEVVAIVSHELRTPLTALRGYVDLIRDGEAGELTEEQQKVFAIIERNADRLLSLVDDLLFVAWVEAGTFELERHELVLAEVVEHSLESARSLAEGKGVKLVHEPGRDGIVFGDRSRLSQLLDNLVANAVKFTPEGGTVLVRSEVSEHEVLLEVSDTGMGIPKNEQPHLFDRFFRSQEATRQEIQGTGLGLSIVQAIVAAHGGSISVESAEHEGTTFLIALPRSVPLAA
jgi:signal transduction histidine kinase